MNNQDVFNKVYEVFIEQDMPFNSTENGSCVYIPTHKNPYGCSIGIFMTKEQAKLCDTIMDSSIVSILSFKINNLYVVQVFSRQLKEPEVKIVEEVRELFKDCDYTMLGRIQNWHDSGTGLYAKASESFSVVLDLAKICEEYGLTWPGKL